MVKPVPADMLACKALVFDLMGTCVDWHSSLLALLPAHQQLEPCNLNGLNPLLVTWRSGFFAEIHRRYEAGEPQEDIDVTHRRVLDGLLEERGLDDQDGWTEAKREDLVQGWHKQRAWPDTMEGISRLRERFVV
jgi:FMN phosphatase YigB (HAD superfamily)